MPGLQRTLETGGHRRKNRGDGAAAPLALRRKRGAMPPTLTENALQKHFKNYLCLKKVFSKLIGRNPRRNLNLRVGSVLVSKFGLFG